MAEVPRSGGSTAEAAYDYVIVGGGSAGCVVASRLAAAEPDATVLLIEAGSDGRGVAQIVDPPSWTKLPGTSLDWGYAYQPTAAVAGRAIGVARGKVLGGCGATNAMLWNRGHPADYDAWAAAGASGWNYAALLPYFRRSESWEGGASAQRGADGPMRVTRPPDPHPIAAALIAGAAALGLPTLDDYNSGDNCGAALANLTIAEGRRFSVVDGYLPAWAPAPAPGQVPVGAHSHAPDPPANLTVLTGSTALRLGFGPRGAGGRGSGSSGSGPGGSGLGGSGLGGSGSGGTSGTRCESVIHTVRGLITRTRARIGVVLALGAFGTPELLIRSGIGDPAELSRLGLPVRAALPGVGRNLQDHPVLLGLNFLSRRRLGLARDNGGGAIVNWRSSRARRPDLRAAIIQNERGYPGAARCAPGADPGAGTEVFAIAPALMGSVSSGYLRVRALDAAPGRGAVEIVSGLLTEQSDVDALVESAEMVAELAATAAYADLIDKPLRPAGRRDRADREAFVRANCATSFHACGTAAMGTGPAAVVDPELNVFGIDGLRIADASVIPVIPTGDIQAPVIAIAERAVDLILRATPR